MIILKKMKWWILEGEIVEKVGRLEVRNTVNIKTAKIFSAFY